MLICTGVRAGGGPYRYSGANSALAVDRNKSATAALAMGFNISEATVISGASIANTSGIPSGVRHPQAWVLPVKGGGIKSYKRTDILIDGAAVGELGFARTGSATITIDAGIVGQLEPAAFDWNVPGFRDDLVDALIRSLPKQLRKLFVPVPETVAVIGERITPDNGPVLESVRRELNRLITEPLPVDAFDLDALPKHLRPSFRIVDTDGRELAIGRDLRALAKQVHAEATAIVATVDTGLEQRGLRTWTFGDLPRTVERNVNGRVITAYPALADDGDSAAIVACTSSQATT